MATQASVHETLPGQLRSFRAPLAPPNVAGEAKVYMTNNLGRTYDR